ncbi:hypothetical protein LTR66_004533 [Elasticomyces elasticus]|nr:hypothetical protein LTR50_006456 [Elasticomyces elasticus]KAK4995692.1 hypothetical protein LTR66_004533 [Elasticomyces elasticus]KAK5011516.1 hypothetical protein LTR28_000878 [Elasticomyces elasticus]
MDLDSTDADDITLSLPEKKNVHDDGQLKPTKVSTTAQPAPATLQDLTDRALRFLATANSETLGACLVGLGAVAYLVLGRVGLVLIGVVAGIVLHATWESSIDERAGDGALEGEKRRRRELGLDVISRVLDWRENAGSRDGGDSDEDGIRQVKLYAGDTLDYSTFRPKTQAALNAFTDAVIRDYVNWWYTPILPTELSFPAVCRQTLTAFILSISSHLSRKRPADAFLDFLTNSSSIIIVFLSELSAALSASPNTSAPDAISTYLQLKPDSNLAHVLDDKHQERKLGIIADDILQNYLDHKTYNCAPARVFLKEVLARLILAATIATCSKPEWINGWIVYLYEEGEPDLVSAIDAEVDDSIPENLQNMKDQVVSKEAPKTPVDGTVVAERPAHRRHVSRAEEAMDEAMQEARRLTQLIQEEEAQRERQRQIIGMSSGEDVSESTTQGTATPTSSESDKERQDDSDHAASSEAAIDSSIRPEQDSSPLASGVRQPFTSFDQLVQEPTPTAPLSSPDRARRDVGSLVTLHNAKISIFDDSMPGERSAIKSKPTADYLIQVEPANSHFPGWMTARKYADFETLHEVLRRISVVTGADFTKAHTSLPSWKSQTKASLREELERYLHDAVRFQSLAESEAMKRFLEKEQDSVKSPTAANKGFPALGWPTPTAFDAMGKGMMDVLTKAPKEVAGGGKALLGGVTSVLAGKKTFPSPVSISRSSTAVPPVMADGYTGSMRYGRESQESLHSTSVAPKQPQPKPVLERQSSATAEANIDLKSRPSFSSRPSDVQRTSDQRSRSPPKPSEQASTSTGGVVFNLPPLPTDIPDNYRSPHRTTRIERQSSSDVLDARASPTRSSRPSTDSNRPLPKSPQPTTTMTEHTEQPETPSVKSKPKPPITEQETQVAIELLFAVITELYTLSSAWNIRRTLLTAAKTFLLRPGNPQLGAIRLLLQESLIDANTSDVGLAAHILKTRENALPTEEELAKWPKALFEDEKEALRVKARRLLVEKGIPQALTSVMGQAASSEALGKVFDCLQVERVAKGLVFGLVLQGVRAVAQ